MGMESLEIRRKMRNKMRFDFVTHDPGALFNIIAKQQRDQAVTAANDAERRQTANPRVSRSMAAPRTKPQGRAADEHNSGENANVVRVKADRSRRYDNNECLYVASRDTRSGTAPEASRATRETASVARPTATPVQQQQSPSGPAQHFRSRTTEIASMTDIPRASAYKTVSKVVVTDTEPAAPEPSRRSDDDYVYIRVPRESMAPLDYGLTETVQHQVCQSAGPQNAAPVLHSVPVQLPAPAPQQSCGDASTISYARVSVLQPGRNGDTSVDTVETEARLEALTEHVARRFAVPDASGAAEATVLMDSGSGNTVVSEELVEVLQGLSEVTQTALTQAFVGNARLVTSLARS